GVAACPVRPGGPGMVSRDAGTYRAIGARVMRVGGRLRGWLLAVFVIFPGIELWGIIEMGRRMGGWSTLGLLILAGVLGTWLAQLEGRKVLQQAQRQMQAGQPPGMSLLDGLCVLVGGLLLLFPGFVSDVIGLTLLIPFTRPL